MWAIVDRGCMECLGCMGVHGVLLIGEHETLYRPQPTLDLARRRMPGLETALVADADHIAAMAQPEAVTARILDFLRPAASYR